MEQKTNSDWLDRLQEQAAAQRLHDARVKLGESFRAALLRSLENLTEEQKEKMRAIWRKQEAQRQRARERREAHRQRTQEHQEKVREVCK
jgi:hypothetical protein